jgi:Zn-dependent oligopeptidase
MWKEIIICITIIVVICIGNIITQNFTKDTIENLNLEFENLSIKILDIENEAKTDEAKKEEVKKLKGNIENIHEIWESKYRKLAYYIEHDELEKVENSMTELKSYIETGNATDALSKTDESVFILQHIEDKYRFSLENIF